MKEQKKRWMIYAPTWMIEAMKRIAAKERRSVNQEMLRAIEAHIQKLEGQNT
jgi:hypothetical protein